MRLLTQKKYDFFEVSSTIQKAIRLGDESTCLHFAVEMFNSGFDEYLWERLMVITSEDVGLAEPHMAAHINALYSMYSVTKKKKKKMRPERLHLVHAVISLCRCKKSRLIDWYMIALWREDFSLPIPDYAYDNHNIKGKQMGRGLEYFYNQGTKLNAHDVQPGEEAMRLYAYKLHREKPDKMNFEDLKPQDPKLDL